MEKILTEQEIKDIEEEVKKEFPNDEALQNVHIARKIISKEAKEKGLSYLEYIKTLNKNRNEH